MKRKIFASRGLAKLAKRSDYGRVEVYSFFPIDRADCECQKAILQYKKKLAILRPHERKRSIKNTGYLECPRSKVGMRRRVITCRKCGEIQGYIWSTDNTLKSWCDFHYVQWTDGKQWYGCLTPHISPITQELCLECCCGQDIRDFRANMTLSPKVAYEMEERNKVGREFGRPDSKFKSRIVKVDVIPFSNI